MGTDRFHKYLYGGQFDVYMDNNPLTYILTSAKLDATGQRWVASLANYDFNVVPHTNLSEYNYHPTDIVCKSTQVVVHKKSRDDWKT